MIFSRSQNISAEEGILHPMAENSIKIRVPTYYCCFATSRATNSVWKSVHQGEQSWQELRKSWSGPGVLRFVWASSFPPFLVKAFGESRIRDGRAYDALVNPPT
jgi:hypothetical protein